MLLLGIPQYYNLGAKHPDLVEKRRRAFADNLKRYAPLGDSPTAAQLADLPPGSGVSEDGGGELRQRSETLRQVWRREGGSSRPEAAAVADSETADSSAQGDGESSRRADGRLAMKGGSATHGQRTVLSGAGATSGSR